MCKINGCDNIKIVAIGLCGKHYREELKHNPRTICKIENCNKGVHGHGYCPNHYHEWRKTNPNPVREIKLCTLEGCEKKHYGQGYCIKHQRRWSRNGDPNVSQKREFGTGCFDKDGYIRIDINRVKYRRNRYILEQKLGRKLLKTEVAHHINKDKQDDRPENLIALEELEHKQLHKFLRRCKRDKKFYKDCVDILKNITELAV